MPPPFFQKRCFSRASSSTGVERREAEVVEEVVAQLEVGRAARPRRAAAAARAACRACGAVRQKAKAASGSRSAATTAPAQPSAGSSAVGRVGGRRRLPRVAGQVEGLGQLRRRRIGEDEQRFHRVASSLQVAAGSGRARTGHLSLVAEPLLPLVAQEPLEDVLAERLGDELGAAPSRRGPPTATAAAGSMPSAARSSSVSSKTFDERLARQLVALLDALQPGGQHHREREVGVARPGRARGTRCGSTPPCLTWRSAPARARSGCCGPS